MNRQTLLQLMVGLTLVLLLGVGCGAPTATPTRVLPTLTPTPVPPTATPTPEIGSVRGVLIGRESNKPIAGAYVLLCAVIDQAAPEPECLLRASLATVTGTDGRFELASVPQGSYLIVYGLSDEAKGNPQAWDGRSVHYRSLMTAAIDKAAIDPFGGNQGVFFRKGSEIGIVDGELRIISGSFSSGEFGLSIEFRQLEPLTISVTTGQIAQITTVEVTGR